jgi:hypothetical protein
VWYDELLNLFQEASPEMKSHYWLKEKSVWWGRVSKVKNDAVIQNETFQFSVKFNLCI